MSVKGNIEEGAGFVEEEAGEMIGSEKVANKGRKLRNKGRIKQGKMPKTTKPGTTA